MAAARAANGVGLVLWRDGDFAGALSKFEWAQERFELLDDDYYYVAQCANDAALALRALGRNLAAVSQYTVAIEKFNRLEYHLYHARSRMNRGIAHMHSGLMAEAEEDLGEAHRVFARLGDERGLGRTDHNLGELRARQRRPGAARRYLKRATDVFERLGATQNLQMAQEDLSPWEETGASEREQAGQETASHPSGAHGPASCEPRGFFGQLKRARGAHREGGRSGP